MRAPFILALSALSLTVPLLVYAQAPTLTEQERRLAAAKADAGTAQQRADALDRQASAERDEAAKAQAEEAAAAARVQAAEADIAAAQARAAIVDQLFREQRTRLAERQTTVLNLVAALQAMARRPAMAGLIQPGSTTDIVHARAVLGTIIPIIQARTADVRDDIARTRELRAAGVQALQALQDSRTKLEKQRLAALQLEAQHRLRSRDYGRQALTESDRAIALGEQARDIADQMQTMDAATATREQLQALPGPLPRPNSTIKAAAPSRLPPPYRLPADGALLTGLGELADTGVRSRGLTLAVTPNAPVVAPAAGQVRFAKAFRDYGNVVILDHGQGWTTTLTGLGPLTVHDGDRIAQGQTLAHAPSGETPQVTVELRRHDRPIDLIPLLQ